MIELILALVIQASPHDPCWDLPGEDAQYDCLTSKYGPTGIQPGESGISWCARQRKIFAGFGGETMGCGTSGYPPDAIE